MQFKTYTINLSNTGDNGEILNGNLPANVQLRGVRITGTAYGMPYGVINHMTGKKTSGCLMIRIGQSIEIGSGATKVRATCEKMTTDVTTFRITCGKVKSIKATNRNVWNPSKTETCKVLQPV